MLIFALFSWLWPQPVILVLVIMYDIVVWGSLLRKIKNEPWDPRINPTDRVLSFLFAPEFVLYLKVFGWLL